MPDINKSQDRYQLLLILLGIVTLILFSIFFYREAFPEYKIYQKKYIELEKIRSEITNEPAPEFPIGIRQIVETREDNGPAKVDRCISCHVALTYPHFSPTKIALDINGNIIYDENGIPEKIPNDQDIWKLLDIQIKELEKQQKFKESDKLKALKTAHVNENIYDVTKVLRMHPLMGRETRPFEFHSIDEYGCVSCHNGNGLALTTEKAHGPITDGQYEVEFEGPVLKFTEDGKDNDPAFARRYNGKPGHKLLFQTTPIFVGSLIQAKCMQCHQSSSHAIKTAGLQFNLLTEKAENRRQILLDSFSHDQKRLLTLLKLKGKVLQTGASNTVDWLKEELNNYSLNRDERTEIQAQIDLIVSLVGGADGLRPQNAAPASDLLLEQFNKELFNLLGSNTLADELQAKLEAQNNDTNSLVVSQFLLEHSQNKEGSIFKKLQKLEGEKPQLPGLKQNFTAKEIEALHSDVDLLTKNYARGEELYMAQACYACHRISGLARGGVGPELTEIGNGYPWYIKQKIVWPQSTLKNSTMPNYHLDHVELEDLMTFLLGQTDKNRSVSESLKKVKIKEWEAGKKNPFEKPLVPSEIYDLKKGMEIFATEGCAACHRLKGFQSNVGFTIEKENPDFKTLYKEREWFQKLVPEFIMGSKLIDVISKNRAEIDKRISSGIRENSILEEIETKYPNIISSFYTDFAFARRAKNKEFLDAAKNESDPVKKQELLKKLNEWKALVDRVLMIYIQEYGLGRVVGPRPNWSGVYRSDEWLMQHFKNPGSLVPNSIMPIFPFDDTKFYALTHMLDVLGRKNRDDVRNIWENFGFNPELAFHIYCAQCHGDYLAGNGPVSEWIYPIPKNLRNGEFLRNLTKENVENSIIHGVKGTPMPPWGETPEDKMDNDKTPVLEKAQIAKIVDWIFFMATGEHVIEDLKSVPKWQYEPQNIQEELKNEGHNLKGENGLLSALILLKPVQDKEDQIFDAYENLMSSPETTNYFIKEKYYTKDNIEAGREFFEQNCAVCHGKEADGTGSRVSIMQDAKPRKLTNLEWLNTRDDLRLLRSIKYGVSGTSMGAWGDMTSSLQRLQLVIFIRSLSSSEELRKYLTTGLYEAFDQSVFVVESARAKEFSKITVLQSEMEKLDQEKRTDETAVLNFQKRREIEKELIGLRAKDAQWLNLQELIKKENKVYQQIGLELIEKGAPETIIENYLALIALQKARFEFKDEKLSFKSSDKIKDEMKKIKNQIIEEIDKKIASLQKEKTKEEENEIKSYDTLKRSIHSGFRQILEIMDKEEKIFNDKI